MTNNSEEVGRHNRSPLPVGESARLETLNEKILAALRDGPQTNKILSRIALDYGRRIRDLRKSRYNIRREPIDGGLNLYTLLSQPDPLWQVEVDVTLSDGRVFSQLVTVPAFDVGTARNRAQHAAHKVKVGRARRIEPIPPSLLTPFFRR
jgi:hypothetical protein